MLIIEVHLSLVLNGNMGTVLRDLHALGRLPAIVVHFSSSSLKD